MQPLHRRRSTVDGLSDTDHVDDPHIESAHRPPLKRPYTADNQSSSVLHVPRFPLGHDVNSATHRFSIMRWRHSSESQLAATARAQAAKKETSPVRRLPSRTSTPSFAAPAIITTAPTLDMSSPPPSRKQKSPFKRQLSKFTTAKHLIASHSPERKPRTSVDHAEQPSQPLWRKSFDRKDRGNKLQRVSSHQHTRNPLAPPAYGDESNSALALPVERLSVSSVGDRSSGEHVTYATTTTTHTISTTTTLFKLPRRNRTKTLFPLPPKVESSTSQTDILPGSPHMSPRMSMSAVSTHSNVEIPGRLAATPRAVLHRRHTDVSRPRLLTSASLSPSHNSLARSAVLFASHPGAPLLRNDSTPSTHSAQSSPALVPPRRFPFRERSSTMSSTGAASEDFTPPTPPTLGSGRNSTSTGRNSLGGFLTFSRFRHNSESQGRNPSPGTHSKSNSFSMVNEGPDIPEREEGDTPGKYLERLQATVSRSLIAGILSKSPDPFAQAVLRSYSRKFPFFGEPIDMSLRKFLLEAELPKETQQVDRVIQAFADRYHECNPGIFQSSDKAYIVAFSLMMLHTDAFNKNNKRKMQKQDYIKNTSGQNVSDDILACLYDNICYTPFIHFDEEVDINGERLLSFKPKKSKLRGTMPDPVRKASGPIDPYALICDGKLDILRPPVKDMINPDDPYTYLGTAGTLDIYKLQKAFMNTGVLQIISARSRPAAFESQATRDNPNDTAAGVVDLKITKVGLLWRKNPKRKKARSPWQEWGAIMTGSQLYLFKNIGWVKNLMAQQQAHDKQGVEHAVVFKPPIQDFKPDALIKTDDAVALLDASYTRHKDAFTLVRQGGQEEVLIAENEAEMNEWISLINYAAAFRSAGVRIRGFLGGNEIASGAIVKPRNDSSSQSDIALAADPNSVGPELLQQVLVFRGKIMRQTIFESEREIEQLTNSLETMLRNARHLLLLAPIQQKTREEVIHAASRLNAMLKWVRRDIWRMKCHRDILARDLDIDGDLLDERAGPSHAMSPQQGITAGRASGNDGVDPHSASIQNPPLTPRKTTQRGSGIVAAEEFFGHDVFKTPPEHARKMESMDDWRLPPLNLDHERQPDHLSVVSGSQSVRKPSTAGVSLASTELDRQCSIATSDAASRAGPMDRTHSFDDREQEVAMLAKDGLGQTVTSTSTSSAGPFHTFDFSSPSATPESASKQGNRRSLRRTKRESRHDQASIHRHRKSKESGSTVKSDGGHIGDTLGEHATVLERASGNFMVHGKKASVITFGGDWSEEKMHLKREIEARVQAEGLHETDESGPEGNLRRHVQRQLAGEMQGSSNESVEASNGQTPSDAEAMYENNQSGLAKTLRGYFGLGSATSDEQDKKLEKQPSLVVPVFTAPTQKIVGDPHKDVAPQDVALPVSPPEVNAMGDEERPSHQYICDDTLRQLSQADTQVV